MKIFVKLNDIWLFIWPQRALNDLQRTRLSRRPMSWLLPRPLHSPISKLDTGRLRKIHNLLMEEEGRSQIIRERESLVLYKSFILSGLSNTRKKPTRKVFGLIAKKTKPGFLCSHSRKAHNGLCFVCYTFWRHLFNFLIWNTNEAPAVILKDSISRKLVPSLGRQPMSWMITLSKLNSWLRRPMWPITTRRYY